MLIKATAYSAALLHSIIPASNTIKVSGSFSVGKAISEPRFEPRAIQPGFVAELKALNANNYS